MPVSITPILNVSDVPQSLAWFEALGWKRGFSWNDNGQVEHAGDRNEHGTAGFGSVCSGKATIFLCHEGQGSHGTKLPRFPGDDDTDGVWMTWWMEGVADLEATHDACFAIGFISHNARFATGMSY